MLNNNPKILDSVFNRFPEYGWDSSSLSENAKSNLKMNNSDVSQFSNVKDILQIEKTDKRPSPLIGLTVASSVMLAGVAALILTFGVSGSFYRKLTSMIMDLNAKIYKSEATQKPRSLLEKADIVVSKGIK